MAPFFGRFWQRGPVWEKDTMPYEAQPYVPGMMVVGASTNIGERRKRSNIGTYVEVYAPRENLPHPLGTDSPGRLFPLSLSG
ncbi:hypothetical protein QBC32DRAFT_337643 [Pseudoneurospora amorphoporcata]|uniref:Uncharacterized protein n=1 Tax=Pseudoneurospora amorphoporcata TaxID=241081 RepID=A0AAN6NZP0_9PEZI|nr:hypothetical protein QBC32DRAFT_337643 [Pseudoneurospora amorphoporcata]